MIQTRELMNLNALFDLLYGRIVRSYGYRYTTTESIAISNRKGLVYHSYCDIVSFQEILRNNLFFYENRLITFSIGRDTESDKFSAAHIKGLILNFNYGFYDCFKYRDFLDFGHLIRSIEELFTEFKHLRYLSIKFYDLENAKSVDPDVLQKLISNWSLNSISDRPLLYINLPKLEYLHVDTLLELGVTLESEPLKNFPLFYYFDRSYRATDLAYEIGYENMVTGASPVLSAKS